MLQALLNASKNSLSDRGIMNVSAPTPGTPDAGELWQPSRALNHVIKDPIGFSKNIENNLPGSTDAVWDAYQENKRLPIDGILKMIKEHKGK